VAKTPSSPPQEELPQTLPLPFPTPLILLVSEECHMSILQIKVSKVCENPKGYVCTCHTDTHTIMKILPGSTPFCSRCGKMSSLALQMIDFGQHA